ncbi:hypothetical protein GDO86_020042, partial [Hymenochirus boettgeri]
MAQEKQRTLRCSYLLAAADISCLFMQFSVTPHMAKSLGLDAVGIGYLQTFFGILQLIGGPIFGRFSDQYGARAALTLSFLSSSLYYAILTFTTNIPLLFISRIPSIFMHGLPGTLSAPTYIALAVSLLCCAVVSFSFPPKTKIKQDGSNFVQNLSKPFRVFNLEQFKHLLSLPDVKQIFIVKVLSGFPIGIFMIMFSVISVDFFGLNAATAGYLMSYFGILQMVFQGIFVGLLTAKFPEDSLLLLSLIVSTGVGFGM